MDRFTKGTLLTFVHFVFTSHNQFNRNPLRSYDNTTQERREWHYSIIINSMSCKYPCIASIKGQESSANGWRILHRLYYSLWLRTQLQSNGRLGSRLRCMLLCSKTCSQSHPGHKQLCSHQEAKNRVFNVMRGEGAGSEVGSVPDISIGSMPYPNSYCISNASSLYDEST
jgi:hypothetical protein